MESWNNIYEDLIGSYVHVAAVEVEREEAIILRVPEGEDAATMVRNLRPIVMGGGICAQITTFLKGTSMKDALQMLRDGKVVPDRDGSHIVVMKTANAKKLAEISVDLRSNFTREEAVGIDSVLSNLSQCALEFVGNRMIAVGFEERIDPTDKLCLLSESYKDIAQRCFSDDLMKDDYFDRMIKSKTIWFGDIGYPHLY